jgi:hypothetical protein
MLQVRLKADGREVMLNETLLKVFELGSTAEK